jgi:hypothetical protein
MILRPRGTAARYRVGWHEELGWWVATSADPNTSGPAPCWLGSLVPSAHRAAELLDAAVREGVDHQVPPRVLRYRLTDEETIIPSLLRAAGGLPD